MRRWTLLLAAVTTVLALAACQPATEEGSTQQVESASGGELVVYSGRSESLVQPIMDRFEDATGIEVLVKYGGTAELATTILEEGDRSPADIFYAQDPGGLGAVEAAGLLAQLPEQTLALPQGRFVSPDGRWVGISGRARVVVYNTSRLAEADLPADLWGFSEPEWRGRIGWAPTNGSFQAMVTAMRGHWGEARTEEWLAAIQANEAIVYEGNTPIVAAVGAGEIDLGFVNHYYLYRFLAEEGEDFPARNYFLPAGGPGSLIMVSAAGILQSADNRANAERFIAYLLSEEAQQYFSDETYEYPVVDGVTTSPLLPPLSDLDAVAADISLTELADLAGTAAMLSRLGILP